MPVRTNYFLKRPHETLVSKYVAAKGEGALGDKRARGSVGTSVQQAKTRTDGSEDETVRRADGDLAATSWQLARRAT